MPKIYDRHNSEIGRIVRVEEGWWFGALQTPLLSLANTDYGKDLLCIPRGYKKIFKIGKNHVFYNPRLEDGVWKYDWDFRVGAKWANVIRYRWSEIQGALLWQEANTIILPSVRQLVSLTAAFGGPYYPDPDPETTTVDGVCRNQTVGETWQTNHDATASSDVIDNLSDPGSSGLYAAQNTINNTGNVITISRSFFLFDTSAIPDTDSISAATLSLAAQGTVEQDQSVTSIIVIASTPASNTAIVLGDYDQLGTTSFGSFAIANWVETNNTYNDITINATGRGQISKTGVTKFGLREELDRANTSPGTNKNNNVAAYFAETAGTTSDPKLTGTSAASGPANLKTFNAIATASVKTINTIATASVKSVNTIT